LLSHRIVEKRSLLMNWLSRFIILALDEGVINF
jgi:hypothetical protein